MRIQVSFCALILILGLGACVSVDSAIKSREYSKAEGLIDQLPEPKRPGEHAKLADALLADFKASQELKKTAEPADAERLALHYRKADPDNKKRGLLAVAEFLGGHGNGMQTDDAVRNLLVEAGLSREEASSRIGEQYFSAAEALAVKKETAGAEKYYLSASVFFQDSKRIDRMKATRRAQTLLAAQRLEAEGPAPDELSAYKRSELFGKEVESDFSVFSKNGVSDKDLRAFKLELYLATYPLMPSIQQFLLTKAMSAAGETGNLEVLQDLLGRYEKTEKPRLQLRFDAVEAALLLGQTAKALEYLESIAPNASFQEFEYAKMDALYQKAGLDPREAGARAARKAAAQGKIFWAVKSVYRSADPALFRALSVHYGTASNSVFDKDEEDLLKAAAATASPETIAAAGAGIVALDPRKVEDAMAKAGVPAGVYAKPFGDAMMDREPTLARAYYLKAGDKASAAIALGKMLLQGKALVERTKGMFESDETQKAKVAGGALIVRAAAKEYWLDGQKKEARDALDYLMRRDAKAFSLEAFGLLLDFGEAPAKAAQTVLEAAKTGMWTTPAYQVAAGNASAKASLVEAFNAASTVGEKRMHAILLHRLGVSAEASKSLADSRAELLKFTEAAETEIPNTDAGKLASALFDMGLVVGRLKSGEKILAQLYLTVAMDNILIAYDEKTARETMAVFSRLTDASVKRLLKLPPAATDADVDGRIKYGNPDYKVGWVMAAAGAVLPTAQKEFARIAY